MKTFKFEISLVDAMEMAALLTAMQEMSQDQLLNDPSRVNLIARVAQEWPKQITEKHSLIEIQEAIREAREEYPIDETEIP